MRQPGDEHNDYIAGIPGLSMKKLDMITDNAIDKLRQKIIIELVPQMMHKLDGESDEIRGKALEKIFTQIVPNVMNKIILQREILKSKILDNIINKLKHYSFHQYVKA